MPHKSDAQPCWKRDSTIFELRLGLLLACERAFLGFKKTKWRMLHNAHRANTVWPNTTKIEYVRLPQKWQKIGSTVQRPPPAPSLRIVHELRTVEFYLYISFISLCIMKKFCWVIPLCISVQQQQQLLLLCLGFFWLLSCEDFRVTRCILGSFV